MRKGRITIPTDENYVEGTKRIADLWGADAVRDCDGVKLPKNPKEIANKVYNVYFVDRGNHEWAKNNPDEWQHLFVMTPFVTATENSLNVVLMDTFFDQQVTPDYSPEALKHMEVMDRTTGEVHTDFTVNKEEGTVVINNTTPFHQYTVAFLMISLWHPVHMYEKFTNLQKKLPNGYALAMQKQWRWQAYYWRNLFAFAQENCEAIEEFKVGKTDKLASHYEKAAIFVKNILDTRAEWYQGEWENWFADERKLNLKALYNFCLHERKDLKNCIANLGVEYAGKIYLS